MSNTAIIAKLFTMTPNSVERALSEDPLFLELVSLSDIDKALDKARREERQRCIDIVKALKADEVWCDNHDGGVGAELVEAACDELVRRIEEEQ